jgi:hypothetical protein
VKRSTAICALALLLPVAVWLFGVNIFALAWHASHGFHREMNGVRFYVPLLYREDDGSVYNEFSFYTNRSPLSKKDGSITIGFQNQEPKVSFGPMDQKSQHMLGVQLRAQRSAKLAEQSGDCFEYGIDVLTISATRHGFGRVWIECRFRNDLRASFDGSSSAIPDFYDFLDRAKLVQRNH